MVQLLHLYMITRKIIALTRQIFVGKVMSLLFNTLTWFVINFLPRSKRLNFVAAVTVHSDFRAQENKICHCVSILFPSYLPRCDGAECCDLSFLMLSFKPAFSLYSFTIFKGSLVPLHFLRLEWYHLHIWRCWYFSQQSWFQLVSHTAWHFKWCTLHRS